MKFAIVLADIFFVLVDSGSGEGTSAGGDGEEGRFDEKSAD